MDDKPVADMRLAHMNHLYSLPGDLFGIEPEDDLVKAAEEAEADENFPSEDMDNEVLIQMADNALDISLFLETE